MPELPIDTIIHADCMDSERGLPSLPEGCVDAVITDPPYGVGIAYATAFPDNRPFVQELLSRFIPEAIRISAVVLFPSGEFPTELWLYRHFPPVWRLCWYKGSPGILSAVGFSDWEMIMVYGDNVYRGTHDYFYVAPEKSGHGEHPCPKPIGWADWLVRHFTDVGDLVVDPFIGSGTTAVACVQTGRHYIGYEIDEGYCEIARQRVAEAEAQPRLIAPAGSEPTQGELQLDGGE